MHCISVKPKKIGVREIPSGKVPHWMTEIIEFTEGWWTQSVLV
jgi:hypothetical protein